MKRVLKAASKSVRFEAPATSVNLVDDDIPSNQIKIVAKLDGKDAPRVTVMVDLVCILLISRLMVVMLIYIVAIRVGRLTRRRPCSLTC